MPLPRSVAVIGAGISGLACAQSLNDAGVRVLVFERAQRVGGRCATRRVTLDGIAMQWDFGAQFAAPADTQFAQWLHPYTDGWAGFRVGVPGMDAVPAAIAGQLDVRTRSEVIAVWRGNGGWNISAITADLHPDIQAEPVTEGPFDAIVVALPAPLAERLLPPALATTIRGVTMAPIWVGMLGIAAPPRGPATMHAQDGPLDWQFRDSDKPGRHADVTCWSIQTGAGWSVAHLDRSREEAAALITRAFTTAREGPGPIYAAAHLWPHALVQTPLQMPYLYDPAARIGACGDWCLGARVQDAWLSGRAMAAALLA